MLSKRALQEDFFTGSFKLGRHLFDVTSFPPFKQKKIKMTANKSVRFAMRRICHYCFDVTFLPMER